LSDDSEAVVKEVSKAVSAALDEFHFSVEAFGDAVGFGEAPHTGNGLSPSLKSISQGVERFEAAFDEFGDVPVEAYGESLALLFGAVLYVEQGPKLMHLLVEGLEGGIRFEEVLKTEFLGRSEIFSVSSQER
jgi:hypothetical protein